MARGNFRLNVRRPRSFTPREHRSHHEWSEARAEPIFVSADAKFEW